MKLVYLKAKEQRESNGDQYANGNQEGLGIRRSVKKSKHENRRNHKILPGEFEIAILTRFIEFGNSGFFVGRRGDRNREER